MATNIVIPKLGMTMTKAKITEWKGNEGQWIEVKNIVLVIETEKVSYEVEALASGFLHILTAPGTEANVGEAVGQLAESEEELVVLQAKHPSAASKSSSGSSLTEPVVPKTSAGDKQTDGKQERIIITPKARKMAEVHHIDYEKIQGSGPKGRIVQEDIEKAIAAREAAPELEEVFTGEIIDGKRLKLSIPLKGMRQVIAEHMISSLHVSAQLSSGTEVDMTEMIKLREVIRKKPEFQNQRLSFTDIFIYILAKVLKSQPIMNASLIEGEIKLWEDINIGVATALQISEYESGLVVPVIRNAEKKSLLEISQGVGKLVEKARQGKLELDDMVAGTFTLTNTGMFGSRWGWSTPIINQPQVGILQTGAIVDRVMAKDGVMVIKPMMSLGLTFDHRVIDGATAANFIFQLVGLMENPYQLID